jgi:hypothetical protein
MFGRDRKGATAKVVARKYDTEATTWARSSPYVYILDVAPDEGGEPFRVEAHITLKDTPDVIAPGIGDEARVTFDPKRPDDVSFDVDALMNATKAARQSKDDDFAALAKAPPGSGPLADEGAKPLDPELQELMDLEEKQRHAD